MTEFTEAAEHSFREIYDNFITLSKQNATYHVQFKTFTNSDLQVKIKQLTDDIFSFSSQGLVQRVPPNIKHSPCALLRPNIRQYIKDIHSYEVAYQVTPSISDQLLAYMKAHPKQHPIQPLSTSIADPIELCKFDSLTQIQALTQKHAKQVRTFAAYAYSCSCGSGKTIAGINFIYELQCRTMIISSRNAVNDQWFAILSDLYPNLVIEMKRNQKFRAGKRIKSNVETDIYIFTPHYLITKFKHLTFNPSLIIFDEVHSLLSEQFIKVLQYPMIKINLHLKNPAKHNVYTDSLPYMIALTATYHSSTSREYRSLSKLFGKADRAQSNIVDIPVHFYDYRTHFERRDRHKKLLKGVDARGKFDERYVPMKEYESIHYLTELVEKDDRIDMHDIHHKGIVMTYKVASSVYAAIYIYLRYECGVLLMRAVDEPAVYLEKDIWRDKLMKLDVDSIGEDSKVEECEEDGEPDADNTCEQVDGPDDMLEDGRQCTGEQCTSEHVLSACTGEQDGQQQLTYIDDPIYQQFHTITYGKLRKSKIGVCIPSTNYHDVLPNVSIIVGTLQRLKEGFSVQNLTWGICTQFVWSSISRIQILGRIRRNSDDPELNQHPRIMYVHSGRITSTLGNPNARRGHHVKYNMEYQQNAFRDENYIEV